MKRLTLLTLSALSVLALLSPVGPGTPFRRCAAERLAVRHDCVRAIGREERPMCLTARTSLMLCTQGK